MKILFLRHGIAEDRDLGKADELRELTSQGIIELEENVDFLKQYLRDESIRLISSNLRRSIGTAEILTEAGFGNAQTMDFVSTGNFGALKRLVKANPLTTLLIVGHSPFLEEWIFAITNQWIEMKKAACAQVEITDEIGFTGFVTWYLPIDKYNRLIQLGSYQETVNKLADDIAEIIEKFHTLILENREGYLKQPAEIESVHKLRVKIRQFRSLVSFFKPLMSKKKQREIQAVLRDMAQECAYLRELDVLIKEWIAHQADFIEAGLTGQDFLAILNQERQAEQDRLVRFLEKPEFARALDRVQDNLVAAIDPAKSEFLKLKDMVETTLTGWHEEIKAGYDAIDANDLAVIHALRIKAKKMRYIMEVFELDRASDSKTMYKEIKRWQEVLGDITDANRNSAAVMEIAGKYKDAPIQAELNLFQSLEVQQADLLFTEFFKPAKTGSHIDETTEGWSESFNTKAPQIPDLPERSKPTGESND